VFTESVDNRRSRTLSTIISVAYFVPLLLLMGGAYAAALGVRLGAWLALTGLTLRMIVHLSTGIWAYRDAFSRPWPKVPPLRDDDDW